MSIGTAIDNLTRDPVKLAAGVAIVLGVVYYLGRKVVVDAGGAVVDTAAGIATGNNAITQSARTSAYESKGILGTLGAAFDHLSGGSLSRVGEKIGGVLADTHERIFQ